MSFLEYKNTPQKTKILHALNGKKERQIKGRKEELQQEEKVTHSKREKYKKKENEVKGSHVCKMESPQ